MDNIHSNDDSAVFVALIHGPDVRGANAKICTCILEHEGNILNNEMFVDSEEGIYFQRVEWEWTADTKCKDSALKSVEVLVQNTLKMKIAIKPLSSKMRIAIMVSKIPHCFHDLILHIKNSKAFKAHSEIVCVISNHATLQEEAAKYGIPFFHVPMTKDIKAKAEELQLKILDDHNVDLVCMARYMQILSDNFVNTLKQRECSVINIHHSFLPAFAGAKPYHQAFKRGVKLIGASAHYATADLDEGPIIAQNASSVSHVHTVQDLVFKGQDLEKITFATAVRLHIHHKIITYKNKTVIFGV